MTSPDLQRLADASERDSAQRYLRQQRLAEVIEEAVRRADAMSRLEASLRLTREAPAA